MGKLDLHNNRDDVDASVGQTMKPFTQPTGYREAALGTTEAFVNSLKTK